MKFSAPSSRLLWVLLTLLALLFAFLVARYLAARRDARVQQQNLELAEMEIRSLQQRLEAERILAQRQMKNVHAAGDLALLKFAKLNAPTPRAPSLLALAIWNPVTQHGLLLAENLPPPAAEEIYQVWLIDGISGNAIRAGTFTVGPSGTARVEIEPAQPLNEAVEVRVSLESTTRFVKLNGPTVASGRF